jgi:uracil-DNA glycosylase
VIHESWKSFLRAEFGKHYFKRLEAFTSEERLRETVFPPHEDVFNAFAIPLDKIRVVILGQDPYHGPGQAHGLCFSVRPGVPTPPSLKNIFKELEADLGIKAPNHGCLDAWVKQGVFLLNTTLTVRSGSPGSHQGQGWEEFTDEVIRKLSARKDPLVFLLWGKPAKAKCFLIDVMKHAVVSAAHPSPLSASSGFFGSKPFSKANKALEDKGVGPVDWKIPEV